MLTIPTLIHTTSVVATIVIIVVLITIVIIMVFAISLHPSAALTRTLRMLALTLDLISRSSEKRHIPYVTFFVF